MIPRELKMNSPQERILQTETSVWSDIKKPKDLSITMQDFSCLDLNKPTPSQT